MTSPPTQCGRCSTWQYSYVAIPCVITQYIRSAIIQNHTHKPPLRSHSHSQPSPSTSAWLLVLRCAASL